MVPALEITPMQKQPLVVLALAALAACSESKTATAPSGPTADLRVIQAVSSLTSAHVKVNGAEKFLNLSFGQRQPADGYDKVGAGSSTFALVTSTGGSNGWSGSHALSAGSKHSVVAVGKVGGTGAAAPQVVVLKDTAATPAATEGWFRFYNATHELPNVGANVSPVDIYVFLSGATVPTTPTRAGVTFQSVTPYLAFAPGTYNVRVYAAGANPATATPISTRTLTLVGGQIRTFVALDRPNGTLPTTSRSLLMLADRL